MPEPPVLTRWAHAEPAREDVLRARLEQAGHTPSRWSNGPNDRYPDHDHPYHKIICCIEGTITFLLTPTGEQLTLKAGDRLDLPAGWPHSAYVGPEGVACFEVQVP